MNNVDELTLDLPNFTGPLDLLLHLIRSQKIDIYDIPIAKITGQYLANLARWQTLDLQIAGEYFVMASTLLRIKSQYLLPKNDFIEEDQYQEDPRTELVEQLVQYSVFQRIAEYFKKRDEEMPITVAKDPSVSPKKEIEPLPLGENLWQGGTDRLLRLCGPFTSSINCRPPCVKSSSTGPIATMRSEEHTSELQSP